MSRTYEIDGFFDGGLGEDLEAGGTLFVHGDLPRGIVENRIGERVCSRVQEKSKRLFCIFKIFEFLWRRIFRIIRSTLAR